jgi:hypothetical protein
MHSGHFRRPIRPLVGAALAAASITACGGEDPFAPRASLNTQAVDYRVYPLSSAPTLLPTALSLFGVQEVRPLLRVNQSLNFEIAVDLDAQGRVRLLPPRLLVAPQGASLVTGMQVIANTTFDALTRAPNTGYQFDSATVVTPGQVVAVQTQGAGPASIICSVAVPMYAKLVVDSIRPAAGTQVIYMRARVDPNCGFRSLEPGLPTS